MSRVGKLPVTVPDGVEVRVDGSTVAVKGPRGELEQRFDPDMQIELSDGELVVRRPTDQARHRALHGLTRSLIANMVQGVTEGFRRSLEIQGVGYRAEKRGRNLVLNVGFSHPALFDVPEGIEIELESPTLIHVDGADKQTVGEVAAEIRQVRPPEPYKGKGIRYVGEQVRRKAGKAAVGGAL
jgi:large subunit ribosomal protein L6